jgi:GNAT superfamily N-acetyltransferase
LSNEPAEVILSGMDTRPCKKEHFDEIVEVIDRWWGGPISTFAHPIFFHELGDKALVVVDEGQLIGFLLGFVAYQPVKTGYVHLVGIHPEHRRRGVGRLLYEAFTETCRGSQCVRMKSIATHANEGSRRFHVALGWNEEDVDDYAGPGRRRIVFTKDLAVRG